MLHCFPARYASIYRISLFPLSFLSPSLSLFLTLCHRLSGLHLFFVRSSNCLIIVICARFYTNYFHLSRWTEMMTCPYDIHWYPFVSAVFPRFQLRIVLLNDPENLISIELCPDIIEITFSISLAMALGVIYT